MCCSLSPKPLILTVFFLTFSFGMFLPYENRRENRKTCRTRYSLLVRDLLVLREKVFTKQKTKSRVRETQIRSAEYTRTHRVLENYN